MKVAITTIYILNCLFLLMVVLLQAGRGGGVSFTGGGGSATLFGGNRGTSTFLQKLTVWSAAAFMALSMVLAHMSSTRSAVEEGVFLDPEEITTISGGEEAGADGPPALSGAFPDENAPAEQAPSEAPVGGGEAPVQGGAEPGSEPSSEPDN